MEEQIMTEEDWKNHLGIFEEQDEIVPVDDVEGEWEDVRKL